MISLFIVAIVIVVALYLIWSYSRRASKLPLSREDFREDSHPGGRDPRPHRRPESTERHKGQETAERGDLKVKLTPEADLDFEFSEELSRSLPEADIDFSRYPEFAEDQCVLIARDSEILFAYWEITFQAIDRYARETGDRVRPRIVLRVYDAQDGSAEPWFVDINVGSRLGNYYLPIPKASAAFYAEIGIIGSFGFWMIARSTIAAVPKSVFGGSAMLDDYAKKALAGLGVSSW